MGNATVAALAALLGLPADFAGQMTPQTREGAQALRDQADKLTEKADTTDLWERHARVGLANRVAQLQTKIAELRVMEAQRNLELTQAQVAVQAALIAEANSDVALLVSVNERDAYRLNDQAAELNDQAAAIDDKLDVAEKAEEARIAALSPARTTLSEETVQKVEDFFSCRGPDMWDEGQALITRSNARLGAGEPYERVENDVLSATI